ncbi:vestitone reductase-like isoform X2 [Tripterygium wilfordii]|uniref:vestitone reductase-like isoform X2 n=1 Tax=Tripterygium wilfordii TaxID=458696 RepID=UPI0018F85DB1|nr:vestitone reductase-like isoform X2 [Tripterygium wilfordii]
MEGSRGKVCVTGGTGYIGSWLVMKLLEHGYSVNTTMRPDPDLNNPGSFDAAIEGCIGVFHTAAFVDLTNSKPEEEVTRTAVKGVLGILKACSKSKTVKRIIHVSSQAAVVFNGKEADIMDESFWTDIDYVKDVLKFDESYYVSKTLAEKAAIDFAEEHGLDLVTVNPPFVSGPFICPQLPDSVQNTLAILFGKEDMYPGLCNTSMVHIDDVVRALIFLFENPDAKGRYNCSSVLITLQEMAEHFTAKYPEFKIPAIESLKEVKGLTVPGLSSRKLLDSGFKFKYGLEEIYVGAIQCCKEKGYL